jgi:ribosomal protein S18 acetylase RimI-like enzyme
MAGAMVSLRIEQLTSLREWFLPDRPGPLVGLHVIGTGNGSAWVDRWPDPRAVVVDTAGNQSLRGDPGPLTPAAVRGKVRGFVEAPERFVPLLRTAFTDLQEWRRVVFVLDGEPRRAAPRGRGAVRRLQTADSDAVGALSDQNLWISKTWGGAAGLAASGTAWGAFADGRLVAVACPFFVGDRYEDIGVATEAGFRGQGWSTACAAGVCGDIRRRGGTPSWTTAPENRASIRVAEKLGFRLERHDRTFVIGIPIPGEAADPGRRTHR